MAERLAYLEAVIGADITQFRKGMRDIRNETGILSETMRGVAGFGRTLTFAYTTPLLVLGTTALQTATEFEAAMYNINSIAGLSADQLAELSAQTLEFGKTTRSGAIASAEALYTVFSAGITDTADAFALMNQAVKTSEAGLANLDSTTNGMIAVMLSYGDTSAEMAQRTSDTITRMVQVGVGSMDAFVSSIGGLVPAAAAVGMEMEEWGADMAFLTQRGLSAAQAGISMNAILKKLISPTEAMSAAFHELGGDNLPELIDQFGSVNEVIEALIQNADGDLSQLYAMFNTTQGQRGIAQFVAGFDAWQQAQNDFNDAVGGATQRAWEEQMKSFAASWDLLKSAVQGAGIAIGQSMFPVLQPLIDMITGFINTVSSANPEILGMATAFLAVSAAIPPLLWLVGSLASPLGALVGAAAAMAVAFETNFGGVRDTIISTTAGIVEDLQPLIDAVEDFWTRLFGETAGGGDITHARPDRELNPYDFIVVSEPKSLWQVYEEMGYADRFSWQEFIDAAFAGGWQGGVVTPDTPIRINPRIEFVETAPAANAEDAGIRQLANQAAPSNLFGDAIERAMLSVDIERIKQEFFTLVQGIVPEAAQVTGWLAGALSAMIVEGIELAIDYVFSGKAAADASKATSWFDTYVIQPFSTGFSQAIEGTTLDGLLTSIEGIKTQVVEALDLEDEANFEGFRNLANSITTAMNTLAEADWSGVAKLGVILAAFSFDALDSLASGAGLIIVSLANSLADLVNSISAFANGDVADGLALLSGALLDFGITLLQLPIAVIDTLVSSVGNLIGLDVPSIGAWLDDIRTQIDEEVKAFIERPDAPTVNALEFIGLDFGGSTGTDAGKFINDMLNDAVAEVKFTPSWLLGGTGDGAMDWLFGGSGALPNDVVLSEMNINFSPDTITTAIQNLNALIGAADVSEGMRTMAQSIRDSLLAQLEARGIPIPADAFITPDHIVMPDGTIIQLNQFVFDTSGATPTNPAVLPVPTSASEIDASGMVNFTPTGATLTTGAEPIATNEPMTITPPSPLTLDLANVALATSEEMLSGEDAQTIITNNFIPIQDAWVAMFAEDGMMAMTFATFSTGVATGWTNIETEVIGFNETMMTAIPEISTVLTTATTTWSGVLSTFAEKVQATQSAVNALVTAIKQLMSMQGTFSIDVNVTGSLEPDGSHKGGLDYVPYDGYLAELHKGERVLTAEENKEAMMPANTIAPRETGGSSEENHVTVNINGVQDVDRILFELRRRGIDIRKK